jgi:Transposase and inactivated derivatives
MYTRNFARLELLNNTTIKGELCPNCENMPVAVFRESPTGVEFGVCPECDSHFKSQHKITPEPHVCPSCGKNELRPIADGFLWACYNAGCEDYFVVEEGPDGLGVGLPVEDEEDQYLAKIFKEEKRTCPVCQSEGMYEHGGKTGVSWNCPHCHSTFRKDENGEPGKQAFAHSRCPECDGTIACRPMKKRVGLHLVFQKNVWCCDKCASVFE